MKSSQSHQVIFILALKPDYTHCVIRMIMGDQQIGHCEEGGVHDPRRGRQYDDGRLVLPNSQDHAANSVNQLAADVDFLGT